MYYSGFIKQGTIAIIYYYLNYEYIPVNIVYFVYQVCITVYHCDNIVET